MKEDYLTSIIMPAYNAEKYLLASVASVVQQSHKEWELLIVDDCSTDDTFKVMSELAEADSRIKVFHNTKNGGPAKARNTALENAEGVYIAFLDSDDLWMPTKLESQLDFMKVTSHVFTYTQYRRVNSMNTKIGSLISIPEGLSYSELLKNTAIATSTVIINREVVGDFRMTSTYYDDFVLWLEIMKRGYRAYGLQSDLMRYRVLTDSVSRNKYKSSRMVWKTYREIEKLNFPYSAWCYFHYALRGYLKYRKF